MCKECEECKHGVEHKVDFVGVEYDDYGTAFYFAYMYCPVEGCDCSYDIDISDEDDYLYFASLARRRRPRLGD